MLARAAALAWASARAAPLGAREFAAAASQAAIKLPDPPTSLSGTSASIATLTWQVAAKENQLEKVQDELHQMVEAFQEMPELARVAVDPFLSERNKAAIFNAILKDSGATEITKRLFAALAEENALAATLQVSSAYDELMLAHKKEVHCNIITAEPLDKLERAELRKQAAAFVEPGFKLVMAEKVDRKLLGGFVLEFEDRLVDMSRGGAARAAVRLPAPGPPALPGPLAAAAGGQKRGDALPLLRRRLRRLARQPGARAAGRRAAAAAGAPPPSPPRRPATPVMAIAYEGATHRITVYPGPQGRARFEAEVRALLDLPAGEEFDVEFLCRAPDTGALLSLDGIGAFDAATHCAALTAAERVSKAAAGGASDAQPPPGGARAAAAAPPSPQQRPAGALAALQLPPLDGGLACPGAAAGPRDAP
ncbi:ATP5PO [Scenedesmus sp. PABB004]|nr:ATP5PO [Scenedesmus sp. PABB004]